MHARSDSREVTTKFAEKSEQIVTLKNNNYNRNVSKRNERIKGPLEGKETAQVKTDVVKTPYEY